MLHYCKFIAGQDEPLFATENERGAVTDETGAILRPAPAEAGWYEHGLYPFVFDPMFRSKGTPCGFGYIDVGKNTQEYIDRGDQAIMQNMLALQFYSAGFFDPARADAALACLGMMDFDRKDFVMARIAENAGMARELAAVKKLAAGLARALGEDELAVSLSAEEQDTSSGTAAALRKRGIGESAVTKAAREAAAQGPEPA